MQPAIQKPARDKPFLSKVLTIINEHLRRLPVETGRIGKMQAAFGKVLCGFGLVPFKLPSHLVVSDTIFSGTIYHERNSLRKLYMPVHGLWINNILRQIEWQLPNAESVKGHSNPEYSQLTGTEMANA